MIAGVAHRDWKPFNGFSLTAVLFYLLFINIISYLLNFKKAS